VPPGKYTVAYSASDNSGASVSVDARVRGLVQGVSFEAGYPQLKVNGSTLKLSDVVAIELAG